MCAQLRVWAPLCLLAAPSALPTAAVSPTRTPVIDLTQDGNARRAVDELAARAGDGPVIRVTVNAFEATLTYLEPKDTPLPLKTPSPAAATDFQAVSLGWVGGVIEELDSDVAYIQQTTFSPADYNLEAVARMFRDAAAVSGSSSQQELQINEYNQGRVLMTVTTNPETSTVFFRHDASLISRLDFSTDNSAASCGQDLAAGRAGRIGAVHDRRGPQKAGCAGDHVQRGGHHGDHRSGRQRPHRAAQVARRRRAGLLQAVG